ncbi:MAG: hypothetical protein MZV64_52385 [Ignavibacteriales bacterium]|nr:hypothetical protein [Ignavibacteriales bacterium]
MLIRAVKLKQGHWKAELITALIEVEEKVVEEKKKKHPTYFVAVEEMPEPIGGIDAIQQLITVP